MGRDPFQQFPDRTSPAVDYRGKTTKCEPTAAAAIVVAFLLSNGAVQDHWPEFGGGASSENVLEAGVEAVSTCAGV